MADSTDDRKLIRSERAPGRNYDLFSAPSVTRILADGVSGFSIGPAVARIDFFQVARIEEGKGVEGQPLETREDVLTLVMPTIALTQFLTTAIQALRDNQQTITQGMTQQGEQFEKFIKSFEMMPDADKI
jgi:hypothetical protein